MRLFSEYRGLRRENYVLFFGRIVTNMGSMIWAMMTMILNLKMGYNATETATVTVIGTFAVLPFVLLGGKLADRYNKKNIIVICDGISVTFYILCGFLPLSLASIALIITASAFQSIEGPAYNALIADINPTKDRERAYSLLYLGANIGLVLSPTIAGFLFKELLWLAFIISGVSIGISTLLILIFLKDTTPCEDLSEEAVYQKSREGESSFAVIKQNIPVLIFVISFLFYEAAYSQFNYLIPLDLGSIFGEDGALTVGTLTSVNCVVVILFTPIFTRFMAKVREIQKCIYGEILQVVGYAVFVLFMAHMFSYYAATVLFTFGEILTAISYGPYVSKRIPASHRGRLEAMSSTLFSLFMGASQYSTGIIYDDAGSGGAWIFTFILCGIGIALMLGAIEMDKKRYPILYSKGQTGAAPEDNGSD